MLSINLHFRSIFSLRMVALSEEILQNVYTAHAQYICCINFVWHLISCIENWNSDIEVRWTWSVQIFPSVISGWQYWKTKERIHFPTFYSRQKLKNVVKPEVSLRKTIGTPCFDIRTTTKTELKLCHCFENMFAVTIFSILDATAALSNSCILLLIFRKSTLRTVSNLLLASLALSELLMAVLVIPFSIVAFAKESWPYGESLCLFQGYLSNVLCLTSAAFTSVIAVDRFYCVSSPISHAGNISGRHIVIITIIVYIQAAFLSLFPLLGIGSLRYSFITAKLRCTLRWDLHGSYLVYYFLISTVGFVIPACTIIVMHYKSLKEARKSARQIRPGNVRVQVLKDGHYTTVAQSGNSPSLKANITLFVIIGTFLVSRAPIALANIMNGLHGRSYFSPITELSFAWLLYLSSVLDPYVYTFFNRRLRNEVIQIAKSCFVRKKQDEEPKDILEYLRHITDNHVSSSPSVASVIAISSISQNSSCSPDVELGAYKNTVDEAESSKQGTPRTSCSNE